MRRYGFLFVWPLRLIWVLAGVVALFYRNAEFVRFTEVLPDDVIFEFIFRLILGIGGIFSIVLWIHRRPRYATFLWFLHETICLVFIFVCFSFWITALAVAGPITVFSGLTYLYLIED